MLGHQLQTNFISFAFDSEGPIWLLKQILVVPDGLEIAAYQQVDVVVAFLVESSSMWLCRLHTFQARLSHAYIIYRDCNGLGAPTFARCLTKSGEASRLGGS